MKRILDIFGSIFGLLIFSPILLITIFLIWLEDKKSPFYIAERVGVKGKLFKMIKLRSMVINAYKTGVDSTSESDSRITSMGKFIRKYKLDELSQLLNVLLGDMSLVGPRPNVQNETNIYTKLEKNLLNIKPGITDFSSIIFSDESKILKHYKDPDLAYNQLIRPWKSRLGLFYVENNNILIDLSIILITIIGITSRRISLLLVSNLLKILKANKNLIEISSRRKKLTPFAPPGADNVVKNRNL
tara:strand:+ start:22026 stop:22757 length:732 start_codon:yes stop_codon:yes gene_type:complete